jgi:hypothetical protein
MRANQKPTQLGRLLDKQSRCHQCVLKKRLSIQSVGSHWKDARSRQSLSREELVDRTLNTHTGGGVV